MYRKLFIINCYKLCIQLQAFFFLIILWNLYKILKKKNSSSKKKHLCLQTLLNNYPHSLPDIHIKFLMRMYYFKWFLSFNTQLQVYLIGLNWRKYFKNWMLRIYPNKINSFLNKYSNIRCFWKLFETLIFWIKFKGDVYSDALKIYALIKNLFLRR